MSNKAQKRGLVPKLRFPEFRDKREWCADAVDDLISTITPPKKIQTSDYLPEGQFPIIDQGQSDIAGWTNDSDSIIDASEPLIVFGDHTCALKLISRPFAQGADGIKIMRGSRLVDTNFLYQFLCFRPVVSEEYKRHFSILKTKVVAYPDLKSGEQQKIADCLASLDERITLEAQKLDTLKTHKKGLMQQLFPAEGETLPKLRFPEFRDKGEWKEKRLADFATIVRGGSPRPIDDYITHDANGLNWLKIGDIDKEAKFVTSTQEKVIPAALTKTRVVNPGDLILSNSMSFGRPYILEIQTCIHDGWIAVSGINESLDRDYLYYLMMTSASQTYFSNNAAGSGVQNLNADIIKLLPISYPNKKEQQKIADCLTSLDDLITAQTQKLAALKTHKKGLMQQLFPVLEEVPT